MFDAHFYSQKILPAVDAVLRNNMNSLGQYFANEFMGEHDLNNTVNPNVARNCQQLFAFVASEAQRMNNGNMTVNDQQLFQIVGVYIQNIYQAWASRQQQPAAMGVGYGQATMGSSFARPSGGMGAQGFGSFNNRPATPQLNGDIIGPGSAKTSQMPAQTGMSPSSMSPVSVPVNTSLDVNYTHNPLDELQANPVSLTPVADQKNWGMTPAKDRSLTIMQQQVLKSSDEKFVIRKYDVWARVYTDSELDVVKLFFDGIPNRVLAETFVVRMFYNHVEELAIGTEDFVKVRDEFVKALEKNREVSTYHTIIGILDKLAHGPRMVMARYLVEHINRALRIGIGMESSPGTRVKFDQIEDLEELLGPNFDIPLLQVPKARELITLAVNNAVFNALSGYSDVMFADEKTFDPSIIKTSNVFPFSLDKVYPTKAIIPDAESPLFSQFFEAMQQHHLVNKTFVRSIRSVVITNILGQQALREITDKPKAITGQIPSLLNAYLRPLFLSPNRITSVCSEYDELSATGEGDGSDYQAYLSNPQEYQRGEDDQLSSNPLPGLPVDQSIYAIQYKKSPYEYLLALDLLSTMDMPQGGGNRAILSRKHIEVLHPIG